MIKAIVFDFDGLILDTETAWYNIFCEIYREHGVEVSIREWAEYVGTHFDPYTHLEQLTKRQVDRGNLQKRVHESHVAGMEQTALRPGVETYLQTAKRLGLKIGLASSSNQSWVVGFLQKFDLLPYFECVRTSDFVKNVKPDPELYLQALEHLGVFGSEAIAFEDSVNGMKAAKSAGMHCVVVPNPVTSHLVFEGHDLRLNSMDEMKLEDVISAISPLSNVGR